MIDVIKVPAIASTGADAAYTRTIGRSGCNVVASPNGELEAVKLLELGSPANAAAYAKITFTDVTGTTGTLFDRQGSGAISGATPAFFPIRHYPVDEAGLAFGSPNSSGIRHPVWGGLTVTVGSLGSPITFSGLEIWIHRGN